MYTGGLTYVNALALRWFGGTFMSMRWVLLGAFVLWVPAVFFLAARFGSPLMAAGVTALAVLWSVPNYPAPVPSWYNLFLAVFGAASVVRFLDTRNRRWLFVAGLCGGLSFLVKLVGLYYVAGVLLFLLLREQSDAWEHRRELSSRSRAYSVVVSLGLLAFIGLLTSIVAPAPSLGGFLLFVVPAGAVAVILLLREWQRPPGTARDRVLALARLVTPFAAGVAIPIGLYFLAFAIAGGWPALYHGLFVAPQERLEFASFPTPQFSVRRCLPDPAARRHRHDPLALDASHARRDRARGGPARGDARAFGLHAVDVSHLLASGRLRPGDRDGRRCSSASCARRR